METNQFTRLPKDVLATLITYMSFGEVQSLCSTNKSIRSFCLGRSITDRRIWRQLIMDTFKDVPSLKSKLEVEMDCSLDTSLSMEDPNNCWNYITYTNFVKYLTKITQGRIYIRMNDMKEFNKLDLINRNYAAVLENREDLVEFPEFDDTEDIDSETQNEIEHYEISRMLKSPESRAFIEGRVVPDLVRYPEVLKLVLKGSQDIPRSYIINARKQAYYLWEDDIDYDEVSESIKILTKYI